ncbi:ABC transporter permease [Microbacteriaceae bacterium VKM Ac-2855]|nr:ABC transporter permease [Microbacteriaceae bacterium VKM Ac-2855]
MTAQGAATGTTGGAAEAPAVSIAAATAALPRRSKRARATAKPSRLRTVLTLAPFALVLLLAIVGPLLVTHDPLRVVGPPSLPPGGEYLFGTDASGMDIFSRVVTATRINVLLAGSAVIVTSVAALTVGLLTGMYESRSGVRAYLARGTSRALDLFDSVPAIIVAMVLVALYGVNPVSLVVTISIIMTPGQARLVRTEVLRIRGEAYLDAARMAGARESTVLLREVLPNASWPTIENASYVFGAAVILTAALGFLGIGLPPPTAEWGSMIAKGASDASVGRWWAALFPALALSGTVAAVTLALGLVRSRRP